MEQFICQPICMPSYVNCYLLNLFVHYFNTKSVDLILGLLFSRSWANKISWIVCSETLFKIPPTFSLIIDSSEYSRYFMSPLGGCLNTRLYNILRRSTGDNLFSFMVTVYSVLCFKFIYVLEHNATIQISVKLHTMACNCKCGCKCNGCSTPGGSCNCGE